MALASVTVDSVRRITGADSLRYRLDVGQAKRRLTLHSVPRLDVAIVSNDSGDLLAILLSLQRSKSAASEQRTLVRFGPRDAATTVALRPDTIASLRLPKAQRAPHWKDSADFRLTKPGGQIKLITHPPVGGYTAAKDLLEDAFCKPSITVQLDSYLNACFRSLCTYVKCAKKNVECRQEAAQVNAYCFTRGSEDA